MTDFGKGGELLKLENVMRAIDESANYLGSEQARRHRDGMRFAIAYVNRTRPMESPIEAIFYGWFSAIESMLEREVYVFNLVPQVTVNMPDGKTYRFDFSVEFGPMELANLAILHNIQPPQIVVELDGHDFHERTKDQVAYRNERDRDLTAAGWTVLHFSGSELYKNPLKCATEVLELCKQRHDAFSYKVYQAASKAEVK